MIPLRTDTMSYLSEKEGGSCANLSRIPRAQCAPISGYTIAPPCGYSCKQENKLNYCHIISFLCLEQLGSFRCTQTQIKVENEGEVEE